MTGRGYYSRARRPVIPGRLGECADCTLPIRWVRMPSGKNLAVNPTPNLDKGTVAARANGDHLVGFVISRDRLPGPLDPWRFTVHAATCDARPKPSTPPPAADRPLF